MALRFYFIIFLICRFFAAFPGEAKLHQTNFAPWKSSDFEIIGDFTPVLLTSFANVFSGSKNSITRLAPELEGLKGIKFPLNVNSSFDTLTVTLKFDKGTQLLIGIFNDSTNSSVKDVLSAIQFGKGKLTPSPLLQNAISITGMPGADIYSVNFPKGTHTLNYRGGAAWIVAGAVANNQKLKTRNVNMPDGRLWQPFIIEGFYDEKPLFEILGGPDKPVIDEGMSGTENIQGGFEGGAIVKVGKTFHMFPTERAGERGVPMHYDRVKTRIGHWTSIDAKTWKRESTIFQASGTYAITDDDNPLNDRRGAIWSYMPVFNQGKNKWYGYYLTYTVHKEIEPNHSFGRIWQTESRTDGIEGIGGPYDAGKLIMEPGLNSQLWEGRQGVASLYPYPVKDRWLAFYSGAYPYLSWRDYPRKSGKGWFIGLATADSLEGPWTRMDTTVNPVKSIHPWFVENPIVYQLDSGGYIAIFDGGPEGWGHHLPNMIGYTLSRDGYTWSEARYLPIETKVRKWWNIMRTPLSLLPEGNDIYTIVYAAINEKRFHPIGMVQVKLNPAVLAERLNK